MGLTLEEALARVPFFASAKNVKTAPLTGGITNLNYKVEADGKAYVLRITGADTDLLGISRDVEHAANLAAGRLGVAPEVMYFIEPEGYLVTRFVNGKKIPPAEITRPENIRRLARKLRVFHKTHRTSG
jgi:thiamine kinase-like enzyme